MTGVTVSPTTATLYVGNTEQLTATVLPANATNQNVTWESNDNSVTIVNNDGLVTAVAEGSATITVTTVEGGYTAYSEITVIVATDPFVPVTNIINVPATATAGTPLPLIGTVVPSNATNQTTVWSVQNAGTTGASISGSMLNTTSAGSVIVRATITNGLTPTTNYVQDFTITVNTPFIPVTNITSVPTTATAGTPLPLIGTVVPSNATNQTIVWSVQNAGTTGASISGSMLSTTSAGSVIVRATITNGLTPTANYVQDFTITVNTPFIPVTNITSVPTTATAGTPLSLAGTVVPSNATNQTIMWSVQNAGVTGANISRSMLSATSAGSVIVRATITNGLTPTTNYVQDFTVTVNPPPFVPVTDIIDVPTSATVGVSIGLVGTVVPSNATNQAIVWSVQNAGTTGASISGNTLSTTSAGSVIVRATITNGLTPTTNYTQDFTITVSPPPMTGCNNIPLGFMLGTPYFASATIWTIPGTEGRPSQEWSDVVRAPGCNKTAFNGGFFNADCRNAENGFHGHYFSWCMVMRFADYLCPPAQGWRVPSNDDFVSLDMNMGGTGQTRGGASAQIDAWYAGAAPDTPGTPRGIWGGSRFTGTTSLMLTTDSRYWSSTELESPDLAYFFGFDPNRVFLGGQTKSVGSALRCVR